MKCCDVSLPGKTKLVCVWTFARMGVRVSDSGLILRRKS